MISILIPCFNYNAYPLVSKLEKQALILKINFEIICIDDGSFSSKNEVNQKINLLTNAKFIESKKNIGRIKNRILLAEKSQYDNLLYIDVDTIPSSDENFLKEYITHLKKDAIIFGGCIYKKPENTKSSLRYKFGKFREEVSASKRNRKPYKYISSSNFLWKRDYLLSCLKKIQTTSYGNDYLFASILKSEKIDVKHIDNQVIVDNIDENDEFIEKTEQALENLLYCYKSKLINKHSISILNFYTILNRFFLKKIFIKMTDIIMNIIIGNLKKQNPNLFLFDLYRLRYLCKL